MNQLLPENVYGHRKKLEFILEAIKEYAKAKSKSLPKIEVLDFGCGNGTAISFPVAELGVQLTGVDIHNESIQYAEKNCMSPNATFVLGDEKKARSLAKKFDIIICSDVIEHLSNPESTLLILGSILRDSGIVIISIPNKYGPFEIEKFIARYLRLEWLIVRIFAAGYMIKRKVVGSPANTIEAHPPYIPYNIDCGHIRFFTLKDFEKLMHEAGYRLVKRQNGAFMGAPVSDYVLRRCKSFINWNVRIADRLPAYLVSTWYFVFEKHAPGKGNE